MSQRARQHEQMRPPRTISGFVTIPPQGDEKRLQLLMQELGEDEPTVKMQVPPHLLAQTRGPNWGMIAALVFCLAFWGSVIYLVLR